MPTWHTTEVVCHIAQSETPSDFATVVGASRRPRGEGARPSGPEPGISCPSRRATFAQTPLRETRPALTSGAGGHHTSTPNKEVATRILPGGGAEDVVSPAPSLSHIPQRQIQLILGGPPPGEGPRPCRMPGGSGVPFEAALAPSGLAFLPLEDAPRGAPRSSHTLGFAGITKTHTVRWERGGRCHRPPRRQALGNSPRERGWAHDGRFGGRLTRVFHGARVLSRREHCSRLVPDRSRVPGHTSIYTVVANHMSSSTAPANEPLGWERPWARRRCGTPAHPPRGEREAHTHRHRVHRGKSHGIPTSIQSPHTRALQGHTSAVGSGAG